MSTVACERQGKDRNAKVTHLRDEPREPSAHRFFVLRIGNTVFICYRCPFVDGGCGCDCGSVGDLFFDVDASAYHSL